MQDLIEDARSATTINANDFINKAVEYHQQGDIDNAIEQAKLAIIDQPENDHFMHVLGGLYQHNKQTEKAAHYFEKAITLHSEIFVYHFNLGIVYKEMKRFEDSLNCQQAALELANDNIRCLNEIGLLQTKLKQYVEAENTLQYAYNLEPENLTSCINLSHLYVLKEQVRDTIDFANKAIMIDPYRPEPYCNIGSAFVMGNCPSEGVDYLRLALTKAPKDAAFVHQSILMNMLYADNYSVEMIFEEHQYWACAHLEQKDYIKPCEQQPPVKHKILNIAFLSSDFQNHSIAHFLIPLMENLNKKKFQLHCYSASTKTDNVTLRFKQLAAHWRDIEKCSDDEVRQTIKDDNIDIFIDLSGHSLGSRIAIFSEKSAPIQMTFLGYPFSTGLQTIDYRITDELTDPGNTTRHLHTEELLKLSPSFLCYQPGENHEISETPPIESQGYTTFASFNNFSKLTTLTIQTWCKILTNTKNAKIFLKSSQSIPDAQKDTILSTFESFGIHHSRVILHHPTSTKTEHFLRYNSVDVCLDPFPYNGTTTTYEALFMGVPVVALRGNAHYSRVSSGILSNLNHDELIADSLSDYVSVATNLGQDIDALKKYRRCLREALLSSPLTDAAAYGKKFETLLRNAWYTHCEK